MELDSDDELDAIIAVAACFIQKKRKRRPRFRTHPYLFDRKTKGRFATDFNDMMASPTIFKENFRVLPVQFEEIMEMLEPILIPKVNSHSNDCISPREKLCITLEYLASGSLQRHIASCYRVSKSSVNVIIEDVCGHLYDILKPQFKILSAETWEEITNGYHDRWKFPHCLGAIDGKHVVIECPDDAGSCFYNYKGGHSIVLMAVVDHEYSFLYTDIGGYGSEGDATVFRSTTFGKALMTNQLQIPKPRRLGTRSLPHFFVADDAFPLHKNIMKPYQPARNGVSLTSKQRIFNYRLSRARRCVENAFGIMTARFICLGRTLYANPDKAQKIVQACAALHNYLLIKTRDIYAPPGFADSFTDDGVLVEGGWRLLIQGTTSMVNNPVNFERNGRATDAAKLIREDLKDYLNSPHGSVSWQAKATFL